MGHRSSEKARTGEVSMVQTWVARSVGQDSNPDMVGVRIGILTHRPCYPKRLGFEPCPKIGRVAVGITPHGSHRSGLAQLRHPARQVTGSLRAVTPAGTAEAAET